MEIKHSTLILVLVAMTLICFALVAPLTGWLTNPPAITEYVVEGAMMVMVIVGTGFVVGLLVSICRRNENFLQAHSMNCTESTHTEPEDSSRLQRYQKKFWKYLNQYEKFITITGNSVGMMMFAKGALILIIWKAIDARYCLGPLQSYEKIVTDHKQLRAVHDTILRYQFLIALTAFQVIFVVSQILIAGLDNIEKVFIPKLAKYSLKIVVIGNIIMYVYTFLLESEEEMVTGSETSSLPANAAAVPEDARECLNYTIRHSWQTEHMYVDNVSPYLYPLSTEFYLASSVLIVSFLSRAGADGGNSKADGHSSISAGEVLRLVLLFFLKEVLMTVQGIIKLFPYLVKKFMVRERSPMLFLKRFAVFIISSLAVVPTVLQICIVYNLETRYKVFYRIVLAYYILQLLNSIAALLASVIIAAKIRTMLQRSSEGANNQLLNEDQLNTEETSRFNHKKMPINAGDLMMLVATAALMINHLFPICGIMTIADPERRSEALTFNVHNNSTIFNNKSVVELGALEICNDVILGLQILLQTFIIISGHKMDSSFCEDAPDMSYLCEYLSHANLQMWMYSSLTQSTMDKTNPMSEVVFSRATWMVISRCITPMMLFYRLHSVHLLYETGTRLFTREPANNSHSNAEVESLSEA